LIGCILQFVADVVFVGAEADPRADPPTVADAVFPGNALVGIEVVDGKSVFQ